MDKLYLSVRASQIQISPLCEINIKSGWKHVTKKRTKDTYRNGRDEKMTKVAYVHRTCQNQCYHHDSQILLAVDQHTIKLLSRYVHKQPFNLTYYIWKNILAQNHLFLTAHSEMPASFRSLR
jgi:hypothetical protein